MRNVPSYDIAAHRIIWTFVFLFLLLLFRRKSLNPFLNLKRVELLKIFLASLLIAFNWICFIWAVNANKIIFTALGYYINPLVSVTLGRIILKEKLSRLQKVAVLLAALGVGSYTYYLQDLPWVSIALAISFALYGLIKKSIRISSTKGMYIESFFALPMALLYLILWAEKPVFDYFLVDFNTTSLLLLSGIITGLPLIWYASAAQLLKLSTLGFFQYLSPTIASIVAIFLYGEAFGTPQVIAFSLVIASLMIFLLDNLREQKGTPR